MLKMKFIPVIAAVMLVFLVSCGENDAPDSQTLPYSYENKENSELIPNGTVEEHGTVVEASADELIPSEDELGEYEEVFMGGDILDDGGVAGWVLSVSLKDITVNTYNKITVYELAYDVKNIADHVKTGDAVLLYYDETTDGRKVAYDIGRIRTEDSARSMEEIAAAQKAAEEE